MARDESEVLMTHASLEVRSVFVSSAVESAVSMVGLSLPSSDGMTCSGSRDEAVVGSIS